ncbi:MAG TPA: marine proteobacterial sortase target protein [Methylomirabilota bacterium]
MKTALLALAIIALLPVLAHAVDAPVRPRDVGEGTLLWRTPATDALVPAPTLRTDVRITVTGFIARVTVHQEFSNPSQEWAEGVYVFPLPETAAVDHLRMRVGERVIEGVVRERVAAKTTYETAKRQGRRATLVEQERPNVFTTSVANIPPGAPITVEIEYQHALAYEAGQFRLRFPMVVGPRYIPGTPVATPPDATGWAPNTDRVPDASRITPPVRHPARGPINPVSLRVLLSPGVPLARVEAPYHRIDTTRGGDGTYEIALADGAVPADRDFELMWEPIASAAPITALFTEASGADVFAMLMVLPPNGAAAGAARVAREVIFVIDTSGSMHGTSLDQAKAALGLAVGRLTDADRFNVIQFNSVTDGVFAEPRAATAGNRAVALRYVSGLRANGGTVMLPALARALAGQEYGGRLRQVVFLTDGGVGNEEELFAFIREHLGQSRLFTIGIGSAPNSHFMRQAAHWGRGTFTHIGSTSEVGAKMEALFRKLEAPVLTDLHVELPGAGAAEALPDPIPDLYIGEPVMVTWRARSFPGHVVLRGRLSGADWEHVMPLPPAEAGAGLAVHWARAKIASLLDQREASPDGVRLAVIEVALHHHLVSPHTSLVAVDVTPARGDGESLRTHALETNLPDGWDYTAVFGLGQGASGAALHAVLGVFALLFGVSAYVLLRYEAIRPARARGDT